MPAPDPPLAVDADLRPEGRRARWCAPWRPTPAYYERWSQVWEARRCCGPTPVAGDAELGERFVALDRPAALPRRTASTTRRCARSGGSRRGWRPSGCRAAPTRPLHTKLGRGGLADVEWTVQLLQLRHAAEVPGLRTTRTLPALAAAAAPGCSTPEQAAHARARLAHARAGSATRVLLVRGRPGDSLPTRPARAGRRRAGARLPAGRVGQLVDDYRRATRRARAVVERVFYR